MMIIKMCDVKGSPWRISGIMGLNRKTSLFTKNSQHERNEIIRNVYFDFDMSFWLVIVHLYIH